MIDMASKTFLIHFVYHKIYAIEKWQILSIMKELVIYLVRRYLKYALQWIEKKNTELYP